MANRQNETPITTGFMRDVLALLYTGSLKITSGPLKKPIRGFCFLLCHFPSGKAARPASSQAPIQQDGPEAKIATFQGSG